MSRVYAFHAGDGGLIYARQKGRDGWQISQRQPDCGPKGRDLCVFVDGRDVLGLTVSLPARHEGEARRAAPYAIEDELGQAVEDVHVALGPADMANRQIDVVSKSVMETCVSMLEEINCPDARLVASHNVFGEGNWLVETPHGYLAQINARRFALDADAGEDLVRSLVSEADELNISGPRLIRWLPEASPHTMTEDEADGLCWLAAQAEKKQESLLNLRQGPYQSRGSVEFGDFRPWRFASVLSGLFGLVWFASLILETYSLNQRTDQLAQVRDEFVLAGWPEAEGNVAQALRLAQTEQMSGGGPVLSALTLVSGLYQGLQTISGSELRALRYRRDLGEMSALVAFDRFEDADRLQAELEAMGLSVQANEARQSGQKIVGDIIVKGGGG